MLSAHATEQRFLSTTMETASAQKSLHGVVNTSRSTLAAPLPSSRHMSAFLSTPKRLWQNAENKMKKIFVSAVVGLLLATASSFAQDYVRNGKEFSSVQKSSTSTDKKSGYTWKDSKGKTYDIYVSASGACYIIRTSSKTGKTYKSYLSKEISAEICRELGIERKEDK